MHTPVMSERVVALLAPALATPGAILVDATLGLGGHSRALLHACPRAQLVGIDRDARALEIAAGRLAEFAGRTTFMHAVYDELPQILEQLGLPHVHGVLLDLGVSSLQLDDERRGFAYSYDAPLDMRMDPSSPLTAAEVVNTYSVPRADPRAARVRRGAFREAASPGPSRHAARSVPAPSWSTWCVRRPGTCPTHRWAPGEAHVPGAAHRGQRRARGVCGARCRPRSTRWRSMVGSS